MLFILHSCAAITDLSRVDDVKPNKILSRFRENKKSLILVKFSDYGAALMTRYKYSLWCRNTDLPSFSKEDDCVRAFGAKDGGYELIMLEPGKYKLVEYQYYESGPYLVTLGGVGRGSITPSSVVTTKKFDEDKNIFFETNSAEISYIGAIEMTEKYQTVDDKFDEVLQILEKGDLSELLLLIKDRSKAEWLMQKYRENPQLFVKRIAFGDGVFDREKIRDKLRDSHYLKGERRMIIKLNKREGVPVFRKKLRKTATGVYR